MRRVLAIIALGTLVPSNVAAGDPPILRVAAPPGLTQLIPALAPTAHDDLGLELKLASTDGADVLLSRSPDHEDSPSALLGLDPIVLAHPPERPVGKPWFDAAARDGFLLGRGDPDAGALGVRGLLVLQLASKHYAIPDLLVEVFRPGQAMPEPVLLRRLRGGNLDAGLVYRSQAIEAEVPFVELPDAINLGKREAAGEYAKVSLDLDGELRKGSPVEVRAVLLRSDSADAKRFLAHLERQERLPAFRAAGLAPAHPPVVAASPRP